MPNLASSKTNLAAPERQPPEPLNDGKYYDPWAPEELGQRLKVLVAAVGNDKSVEATGKSIRQLKRYMAGDEPPFGVLKALVEYSGATLDWLTYGTPQSTKDHLFAATYGEMLISHLRTRQAAAKDPEERSRLEQIIALREEAIETSRRIAALEGGDRSVPRRFGGHDEWEAARSTAIAQGFVAVPLLDVRASAGHGRAVVIEEAEAQIVAFKEEWLRRLGINPAHAVIIIADGDSMAGTINHGDLVLLDRSIDQVIDDGIYCLVYDGLVKIKRLQRLRTGVLLLKSDNPAYQTEEVEPHELPELVIEGRVRWAGGAI